MVPIELSYGALSPRAAIVGRPMAHTGLGDLIHPKRPWQPPNVRALMPATVVGCYPQPV